MRLVDADELMIHYKDICELCGKYKENNGAMCRCCYLDDAISFLEDMQEIEERHTAEWEYNSFSDKWRCTQCFNSNLEKTKYCPNCGAKME